MNRGRDRLRLGGAEHEHHPLGRLLQRFQQRVESVVGDLVGFVNDEDLVAVTRRAVTDALSQLANVVDAAVRGGIDLDNVHRRAGGNF